MYTVLTLVTSQVHDLHNSHKVSLCDPILETRLIAQIFVLSYKQLEVEYDRIRDLAFLG